MGAYTVTKGGSTEIDLGEDYRDNGWSISGSVATHSACNAGLIKLNSVPYIVGVPNTFRYVVSGYSSGTVQLRLGTQLGAVNSSNGEKIDVFTPVAGQEINFYSDGNLSVELLEIYTETADETGVTLQFDEKSHRWVTYYSFKPDFMLKFINDFFSFKDGRLWLHHSNPLRNNFYGVQYTSKIVFYVNLDATTVKQFFSIREKSNKVWSVLEAYIEPTEGKSQGQRSRLKKGRFRNLQGDFFADFLRDMQDPRFVNKLDALMKGALLQGSYMRLEIENTDTEEVKLLSVDVTTAIKNYSY